MLESCCRHQPVLILAAGVSSGAGLEAARLPSGLGVGEGELSLSKASCWAVHHAVRISSGVDPRFQVRATSSPYLRLRSRKRKQDILYARATSAPSSGLYKEKATSGGDGRDW